MSLEPVRSLWIGPSLPPAHAACIASFLRVGHPFELFTYDTVGGVPQGTRIRSAQEIVPSSRIFTYGAAAGPSAGGLSGFSNLFRFALLAREGGWWVDCDIFCLRPLPNDPIVIGSERRREGLPIPCSAVLRCPAGHQFANYCLARADAHDPATMVHGATGPALVAQAVEDLRLHDAIVPPEAFCCIDWFDHEALLHPGTPPRGAYGVHLWGELWRRSPGTIPWPGPAGSLLHSLARRGRARVPGRGWWRMLGRRDDGERRGSVLDHKQSL